MIILLASQAHGGSVEIPAQIAGAMSVPVSSLKEARFRGTLHQQFDFSCGSAALATLLTHHYRTPVDEKSVFEKMYDAGDHEKIRREGFSLLDMKDYLTSMGFESDGFEAPLESLSSVGDVGIPAIVLVNESGYNHFVVVKGLRAGTVLIGDPAGGTRALSAKAFDEIWRNKILFIISNKTGLARFNEKSDWSVVPQAPISQRGNFDISQIANWTKLGSSDY